MKHPTFQGIVGRHKRLRQLSIGLLARIELLVLSGHKDASILHAIRSTRKERESLLTGSESFLLFSLARAQSQLPGDMAEVGVYQGCSARLLCEAKGRRALHLFDTFDGLPAPDRDERVVLKQHQFATSLAEVQRYLAGYDGVHYHRGLFPDSAAELDDIRFSLVHLDVDLRASTLAGLEFFYPRLVAGGIIISHDYSILRGVRAAFDEYVDGTSARVIELPTTQAMLIRT